MVIKIPEAKLVDINKITVDGKNPNVMSDKNKEALKKAIKKYGFLVPIVCNKNYKVADGEHRLNIAKEIGYKQVPVIALDVDEVDRRILRQIMNKLKGEHQEDLDDQEFKFLNDEAKIDELLKYIPEEKQDIMRAIALLEEEDAKEEKFNEAQAVAEAKKNTKVKNKDIWTLGSHRLMCGDATIREDVSNLMGGGKATMVFTDPPYNSGYVSPTGFKKGEVKNSYSTGRFNHKKIFNDKLKPEDYLDFLSKSMKNCYEFTKDKAAVFLWSGDKNLHLAMQSLIENKFNIHQLCTWVKNYITKTPGCLFNKIMEFCVIGFKDGHKPEHNKKYLRTKNNIFELEFDDFLQYLNAWYVRRDSVQTYRHPTQKPKELTFPAINAVTEKKDIILDLFGGSGSTLMAAEIKERACYMMELDPIYATVILNRWENYTGKKAKKVS